MSKHDDIVQQGVRAADQLARERQARHQQIQNLQMIRSQGAFIVAGALAGQHDLGELDDAKQKLIASLAVDIADEVMLQAMGQKLQRKPAETDGEEHPDQPS